MAANAALASWQTSATTGLSTAAAHDRRQIYGPNVLPESEARSEWGIFFDQFASLPVGLLTVAAGMSLVTGGLADAVVILSVVAINATIGYFTESQSEKTIQSLKHLVTPSAVVVRDRGLTEIPAAEVVPGDILVLKPGSYIAADSRLIEAQRLSVDESALTGESLPVNKIAAPLTSPAVPLADRVNMVYMGTLVTGGQGLAVVVATGRFTEIGQIQALATEAQAPETPLERQLDQMGTQLVYLSSGVCALVFGIGVLQGYGLLEMLKSAISLAVAAVPEGLPTIATTTLALGILNMRRHHVLVRRLDAVETLGCVQTICLDKTGTLTLNKMSVVAAYVGMRRFQIADGAFRMGTKQIAPQTCEELVKLAHVCTLCSETEVERQDTQYRLRGSSTENALLALAFSVEVDPVQLRADYPVVEVTLRAEDRNFMRTLHRTSQASAQCAPAPLCVAAKGSPLEVLAMCTWQMRQGELLPLTEKDRQRIEVENDRMAGEALRVIGAAYRDIGEIETEHDYDTGLTWLGLIGMTDPIRAGVKEVIGGFHRAGIDTVMITGDQSPTAYAIGTALALSRNGPLEILDSTHLANLAPPVVEALVEKVQVFARVSPAHKLQ
ncbi:MAG: HAD family hydrolase, partial [Deltaproteobacteria bacterium]